LDVIDARIRKCKNVSILIDKKMRERRIEHDKYIIMLDDNTPFGKDEHVKIILKDDFEKLGSILKTLKLERKQLQDQVKELQVRLEVQGEYIEKLESGKVKGSESKNRFLKSWKI
jgi:hypothetical protein